MATIVYLLCALTSLVCAVLLGRSYARNRMRLLLWSTLGFVGLTLNNFILFIDKVIIMNTDLALLRNLTALAGVGVILYGLIWDAR
jgi:hypothetical protein